MGTGIRHPSLVSLAIIIETRCNFEYIESHGASMPPPQEDSCKPILRFYSAHSTRNQARQAIANGHGILQAGVENIPPTALRLTDDPDASGMWTLEIKQEVVSLTLNGFVIQMKAKQPYHRCSTLSHEIKPDSRVHLAPNCLWEAGLCMRACQGAMVMWGDVSPG
ncbi:hypothetical protein WJX79_002691 [Trebouxia sp. C0005]